MTTKSYTPSPPAPVSNVAPEPCMRNPRIHRQSGIPSISRPRGTPSPDNGATNHQIDSESTPKCTTYFGNASARKPKSAGYQILSKTRGHDVYDEPAAGGFFSSSRRRFVSMPQALPSTLQAQIDIDNDRIARGLASPPIVDFTRFEDTYRGPRTGNFEGLVPHRNKAGMKNGIRSSSSGVKPTLKTETPAMGGRSATLSVPGTSVQPASARKPDPRLVISSLQDILGKSQRIEGYLDAFELLAAHQLDQLDFEERDALTAALLERGKLDVKGQKGSLVVLGEPIRKASVYSSTIVVLGGREHGLPILVVNCVEELYRTGIYQPHLFRSLPNRARLLELIGIFDSEIPLPGSIIRSRQSSGHAISIPEAGFGLNTSLHLESTPDICALLTTYLSSLPEPILPPFLFRAVWDWCELDDEQEENNMTSPVPALSFGRRHGLPSTVPLARTYTSPAESTHILIAQLLLHLLPSPNFSLLIYLLAFFSQVALVREENGVGVEDLSRMFGGRIFGGGSIPLSNSQSMSESRSAEDIFNTTQTRREGEAMMSWFLRRWAPVSEGLFDVVDDAKMGLFRRTLARKDSLGNDILSTWLSDEQYAGRGGAGEGPKGAGDEEDGGGGVGVLAADEQCSDGKDHVYAGPQEPQPIPRIRLEAPQGHSTPKSKAATSWLKTKSQHDGEIVQGIDSVDDYVVLSRTSTPRPRPNPFEDDTLDITRLPSAPDFERGPAAVAHNERLMDISLPTFLIQTHPSLSNANPRAEYSARPSLARALRSVGVQVSSPPVSPDQRPHQRPNGDKALETKVAYLEKQLKDRSALLSETQKEFEVCRQESDVRARRIVELEKALQSHENDRDVGFTDDQQRNISDAVIRLKGGFREQFEDGVEGYALSPEKLGGEDRGDEHRGIMCRRDSSKAKN